MSNFSPAVIHEAEVFLGRPRDEVEQADHVLVVCSVLARFASLGVFADATGSLRWNGSNALAAVEIGAMCIDLAFDLRREINVDVGRIMETAGAIINRQAATRRQAILAGILGKPSSTAGDAELRRWVRAVTGRELQADVEALRHFLWLVKTKQSGGAAEMHLMPVVVGPQGTGKSMAVARLVASWQELADLKMEVGTLTDERSRPALACRAIGVLDEMPGLSRADAAELKATVTAAEIGYRPMRSNDRKVLPMLMSFIGTSNKSVIDLIHDTSGARRFYELLAPTRCNWSEINAIDYPLLWTATSEDDPAPGVIHRDIIAAEQVRLVWQDPVQRWLDDEPFLGVQLGDGRLLEACDPAKPVPTVDLFARLEHWCRRHGEKSPSAEAMGRRVVELGWSPCRPRVGGRRVQCYTGPVRVVREVDSEHDAETVEKTKGGQGGQGGQGDNSISGKSVLEGVDGGVSSKPIEAGHPDHPDRADQAPAPGRRMGVFP